MATLVDVMSVYLSPSVFDEYLKTTGKPIEASIRGELSGDFEKLMLAVGMSWGPQRTLGCHPRSKGIRKGFPRCGLREKQVVEACLNSVAEAGNREGSEP